MKDPVEIVKAILRTSACERCEALDPSIASAAPCPQGARVVLARMRGAILILAESASVPDDEPMEFSVPDRPPIVFPKSETEAVFDRTDASLITPVERCADTKLRYDSRVAMGNETESFQPMRTYTNVDLIQLIGQAASAPNS
jgi:hypothetical protein